VLEWECCIKHPEDGAREGAKFIADHIIHVTEQAFDDSPARAPTSPRIAACSHPMTMVQPLRLGMVGGGRGAFIGGVHRCAPHGRATRASSRAPSRPIRSAPKSRVPSSPRAGPHLHEFFRDGAAEAKRARRH